MYWGQITLNGLLRSFLPSLDFNLVNRSIMNVSSGSHFKHLGTVILLFSECGDNGISRGLFFRNLLPAAGLWWIVWQLKSWHWYPVLLSAVIVCHLSLLLHMLLQDLYEIVLPSPCCGRIGADNIALTTIFLLFEKTSVPVIPLLRQRSENLPVGCSVARSRCLVCSFPFFQLFCPSGFKIWYTLLSICIRTSTRVTKHVQMFCGTIFGGFLLTPVKCLWLLVFIYRKVEISQDKSFCDWLFE